ncbi:MAG: glycosyltransferase family 1 protein [Chlamydiia bacterium]|nr:glycosyltransferase family 1 protein [Chlamydiia bacterium]
MKVSKILFLVGNNPYQTTFFFAEDFSKALRKQGFVVDLVQCNEGKEQKILAEVLRYKPDLTCSFSDITIDGVSIGEVWKNPHFTFLLDPALYFLHQAKPPYCFMTTVDKEDERFLQSVGCQNVWHLPHAVPKDLFYDSILQERPYDLVFFGTAINCDTIEANWRKNFLKRERDLLFEISHRVLTEENSSILQCLIEKEWSPETPDFYQLYAELDQYIRGKDRLELLRHLKKFSLHIWGDGWDQLVPWAICHPPIPFNKTIDIMKRAKIVLNSHPRLKHGSHERIFYGLACGACVLTPKNTFVQTHFDIRRDLMTYSYGQFDQLEKKIKVILNFSKTRETMVLSGREKAMHKHTWETRADTFATIIDTI